VLEQFHDDGAGMAVTISVSDRQPTFSNVRVLSNELGMVEFAGKAVMDCRSHLIPLLKFNCFRLGGRHFILISVAGDMDVGRTTENYTLFTLYPNLKTACKFPNPSRDTLGLIEHFSWAFQDGQQRVELTKR
jgi:hypothetical protein